MKALILIQRKKDSEDNIRQIQKDKFKTLVNIAGEFTFILAVLY